ncbi:6-phosphogluconate decarboxylating [Colletotrichum musicola]|uniref:phosphogluconate dehydrogenase (NADP(+)-dependent, decarboxylating) n=1 Tax=Colletotrichum musicola TaxID=2175873 RepID=A0A8H6NBI3_9PEZI|nr:6-phosphogluconate decarboxylating [Colletotrichum musicola]
MSKDEIRFTTIGMVGVGSMRAAMSLLFAENEYPVFFYDPNKENIDKLRKDAINLGLDDRITGRDSYENLCKTIKGEGSPSVFVFNSPHSPVSKKAVEGLLAGGLKRDDVIIDCANEQQQVTEERQKQLEPKSIHYVGCGVSGGYKSARAGLSFSPGGSPEAMHRILLFLAQLAARDWSGRPCTGYVGPGGSGHFVKTIHNGIEQGMMSVLSEVWAVMVRGLGMSYAEAGRVFADWDASGPLRRCFLVRIGADVCRAKDQREENPLGHVPDKVVQDPAATIVSAHLFRYASAYAGQRKHNKDAAGGGVDAGRLSGATNREEFLSALRAATFFGFAATFAQGMDLVRARDKKQGWALGLWRGGCIIQADGIVDIFDEMYARMDRKADDDVLSNYEVARALFEAFPETKKVVLAAVEADLCVPALSQSLEYYKYLTSTELPTQFMEAEMDYFGKHMFDRKEDPWPGKPRTGQHHFEWKPAKGKLDKL